jgi:hypothetical protein
MGEHEKPETNTDVSKTIEVKVVAATAGGLLASVAYAVLDALARDHSVLDGLPDWARFVILAAIPPLLTFLVGYAVPSNRV